MKRLLSFLLILVMLLSMAACDAETSDRRERSDRTDRHHRNDPDEQTDPEPPAHQEVVPLSVLVGDHYLREVSDDYVQLAVVRWQSVVLSDACAAEYPKLAKALLDWNRGEWDMSHSTMEDMLPDARTEAEENGHYFGGYTYSAASSVHRADNLILSVRYDYDTYTGFRPYHGTYCLNLDPVTGKNITIDQLIGDLEKLPAILEQELREKYSDYAGEDFDGITGWLEEYSPEAFTWTISYQGIHFYFGAAELAAGALGPLEVTLWFEEYADLIDSKYFSIPEGGYVLSLPQMTSTDVDLTPGDGQWDRIYVEMPDGGGPIVGKNDMFVRNEEYYGYSMDAYLVTPDNKHFYIYLDCSSDNDYRTVFVYDLSGAYPKCVGEFFGVGFVGQWWEDYELGATWFDQVFNDPSGFELGTHMDMLGTMTGTKIYRTDPETGLPFTEMQAYTLPEDRELVSLIDLELQILPELETQTIPAGTKFYFLRTDGETYVDMYLEDGRECRVEVEHRDWQHYVNGIDEYECFDGILYAG